MKAVIPVPNRLLRPVASQVCARESVGRECAGWGVGVGDPDLATVVCPLPRQTGKDARMALNQVSASKSRGAGGAAFSTDAIERFKTMHTCWQRGYL